MKRKQLRINQKISALFLVCLMSLAITGYAYSHWTDILTIIGNIQTGKIEITIDNQKLIPDIGYSKTPDNKTVTISAEITTGWQIWVGIIIKNKGTVPVTITHELTTSDKTHEIYFRNEIHFYGPYTTVPPQVWDDLNQMNLPPPSGEQTLPIDLPAGDKLVVWQKIRLEEPPSTSFTINIHSEYLGTLGPWQDWCEVIYYLRVRG